MKRYAFLLTLSFLMGFITQSSAQISDGKEAAVLNHIAVYVTDLNRSTSFYEKLLHLHQIEEPFKDGKHVWFSLGAAGQMHLIQGAKQTTVHDKNEHLCFSVASIADFIKVLDLEKIDYANWAGTAKAPTLRVDGIKQIYFQDPDGHWLEVNDDFRSK
ncbi:lactoylglutathione lyase [Pedobacter cryoconitis]|uniref:VOC family protein n=1 Tax=Pedobacter cryoconitis TaxID=188932 RepID=UPI00161A4722|nr:VOC family protein [Pedobacter cryoconitis]MBB6274276.1 lactoylglutathione lyase [Pedobacter cryoconitis]